MGIRLKGLMLLAFASVFNIVDIISKSTSNKQWGRLEKAQRQDKRRFDVGFLVRTVLVKGKLD